MGGHSLITERGNMLEQPTPTDPYLAGYIDADGCVRFANGSPVIEVTSVFPFILHALEIRFGGSCREMKAQGENRPVFRWSVYGVGALDALLQLRPYMIEKGPQVDLIFLARETKPGPLRDGYLAQMKALKHYNYAERTAQ